MPSPRQARAQASTITSGKAGEETEASPTSQLRMLFDRPRLSPGRRRIARYLIEHLTEAAFLSITDLAERVGVSRPPVTRFASVVGFSGYPALREKLRAIALGTLPGGPPEENRGNELQVAVDAEIESLENLRQDFADPDRLIGTGRGPAASAPLTVLGLRISASLAEYFAYSDDHDRDVHAPRSGLALPGQGTRPLRLGALGGQVAARTGTGALREPPRVHPAPRLWRGTPRSRSSTRSEWRAPPCRRQRTTLQTARADLPRLGLHGGVIERTIKPYAAEVMQVRHIARSVRAVTRALMESGR